MHNLLLKKFNFKIVLLILFFLPLFYFRFIGNNYDQNFLLHPDERMVLMVTEKISFFNNLDPNFYNYGSFPFYFLKFISDFFNFFQGVEKVSIFELAQQARLISSVVDCCIIILIYFLTKFLFKNQPLAFLASFNYGLFFFPIQNSNFYIVDNFINLFLILLVFTLLKLIKKFSFRNLFLSSLFLSLLLTTKATPVIFLPLVVLVVIYSLKKQNNSFIKFFFWILSMVAFCFIFMPYAFINYQVFLSDVFNQIKMSGDAYVFPYTLQYVNTPSYLYFLKDIFGVGIGPFASLFFVLGLFFFLKKIKFFLNEFKNGKLIIFYFFFNFYYFAVIGRSAVKFMRYFLPLYPFLAIVTALGLWFFIKRFKKSKNFILFFYFFLQIVYCLTFLSIYSNSHSRVKASEWMNEKINFSSKIAVEHWDDPLPLRNLNNFSFIQLNLYDYPDDERKWKEINEKIAMADYLVLSSNRLSKPLQRLSNCSNVKKCYLKTSKYYQNLFNQKLDFDLVKKFRNSPHVPILNWEIDTDYFDESFSVYDHPEVLIFKKKK